LQRIDSSGDPDAQIVPESEFGQTTIVPDMHTRKRMMANAVQAGAPGSGFVALAGGYGTMEEVMEMVTWNQLGIHQVPIILVNINGYWNGLLDWIKTAIREGFVGEHSGRGEEHRRGGRRLARISSCAWSLQDGLVIEDRDPKRSN
jgi:uncharacterized protein (TIGR00730 family)